MADLDILSACSCQTNKYWEKKIVTDKGDQYTIRYEFAEYGPYQYDYTCTCPAYKFGRGKHCKHIEKYMGERCAWNRALEPGCEPAKNDKGEPCCPRCGGEVFYVQVGV